MKTRPLFTVLLLAALPALPGCKTLEAVSTVGTSIGVATGTISVDEAQSIQRTATAAGKAFESITPEQEYYIGRAVAASILAAYKPYPDETANRYVNILGQSLAMASDKPETFGGYHFLIMDSDEVNAFAAPGGLILVSRGLIRCCENEDALAAVLAHEIAHVQLAHGLQAIKKSRLTSAFTILGTESLKTFAGEELAQLTTAFEDSIGDITGTLVNSGYSRRFEREADRTCITILKRVGYSPLGLESMLIRMDQELESNSGGFGKTHPDPLDRVRDIKPLLRGHAPSPPPAVRVERFETALAGI